MEETSKDKVGFAESDPNRKSVSRLGIIVTIFICVFATLIEGTVRILSVLQSEGDVVGADWNQVTLMVGTLLVGSGVIKASQGVKQNMINSKTK